MQESVASRSNDHGVNGDVWNEEPPQEVSETEALLANGRGGRGGASVVNVEQVLESFIFAWRREAKQVYLVEELREQVSF